MLNFPCCLVLVPFNEVTELEELVVYVFRYVSVVNQQVNYNLNENRVNESQSLTVKMRVAPDKPFIKRGRILAAF